jgi:hypothetical protein
LYCSQFHWQTCIDSSTAITTPVIPLQHCTIHKVHCRALLGSQKSHSALRLSSSHTLLPSALLQEKRRQESHLDKFRAVVKNEWSCNLLSLYVLMAFSETTSYLVL